MKVFWSLILTSAITTGLFGSPLSYTDFNEIGMDFPKPESVGGLGNYAWEDGETFPGWYSLYVTDPSEPSTTSTVPDLFRSTNGLGSSPIGLYWFRSSGVAESGSLGTRHFDGSSGSVGTGGVYFGTAITNNTAFSLTSFSLGYTGTQWTHTSGGAGTFDVSYSTNATSLVTGAWSGIEDLAFTSPFSGAASTVTLNGELAENRVVFDPVTISLSETLAPGETLWLRWFSVNMGGIDQSIGIDDVAFSAIPEPSTVALWFGLGTLGLAAARRKGWL